MISMDAQIQKIMKLFNKEVVKIEDRTLKGLIRASIIVRRHMDKVDPLIPVDTGNLRQSWFVVTSKGDTPEGAGTRFKEDKNSDANMSSQHSGVVSEKSQEAVREKGKGPVVILGFSANYATFVHELIDGNFQRPGAGAKFFETALKMNKDKMLAVIKEEVSKK